MDLLIHTMTPYSVTTMEGHKTELLLHVLLVFHHESMTAM